MRPAYPRTEMERRICEAVEAGATLAELETRPGFPCRLTVYRWAKDSPAFAQRLKDARVWRRGARIEARTAATAFSASLAEAFLLRVRRGEAVRDLVRQPGQPSREILNAWKRERPAFARDLAAAVRFARELRPGHWDRYDEAAADEIIVRLSHGEPMPKVLADPTLPGAEPLRRWRRSRPEFDRAIRTAQLAGQRLRMRRRRRLTPKLQMEIVERIGRGASLHAISKLPGMPHYVTLYGWLRRDPEFARLVRAAAREREQLLLQKASDIAEAATPATAARAQRRIGEIRKQLGRMAPKRREPE